MFVGLGVFMTVYMCVLFHGSFCVCVSTMDTHRDAEEPGLRNPTPGRRTSWVKEDWKVWMCVSVSEDPPPPGDTL